MAKRSSVLKAAAAIFTAGAAAVSAYMLAVRPWHRKWGATEEEFERAMPGDDLVPDANFHTTRAITIDAPPSKVWPWLVQMGQGRGGLYSYDFLENLVGLDFHSTDRVVPELQSLKKGEVVALEPEGSGYTVADIQPQRYLLLYASGDDEGIMGDELGKLAAASTWLFLLEPLEGDRTRLIVRWRARIDVTAPLRSQGQISPGGTLIGLALDPVEFVMERKMMLGIKKRAEQKETQ